MIYSLLLLTEGAVQGSLGCDYSVIVYCFVFLSQKYMYWTELADTFVNRSAIETEIIVVSEREKLELRMKITEIERDKLVDNHSS